STLRRGDRRKNRLPMLRGILAAALELSLTPPPSGVCPALGYRECALSSSRSSGRRCFRLPGGSPGQSRTRPQGTKASRDPTQSGSARSPRRASGGSLHGPALVVRATEQSRSILTFRWRGCAPYPFTLAEFAPAESACGTLQRR